MSIGFCTDLHSDLRFLFSFLLAFPGPNCKVNAYNGDYPLVINEVTVLS